MSDIHKIFPGEVYASSPETTLWESLHLSKSRQGFFFWGGGLRRAIFQSSKTGLYPSSGTFYLCDLSKLLPPFKSQFSNLQNGVANILRKLTNDNKNALLSDCHIVRTHCLFHSSFCWLSIDNLLFPWREMLPGSSCRFMIPLVVGSPSMSLSLHFFHQITNIHMEPISRKCYANHFKGGKYDRQIMSILSSKQYFGDKTYPICSVSLTLAFLTV